jgi:hypothetical protein
MSLLKRKENVQQVVVDGTRRKRRKTLLKGISESRRVQTSRRLKGNVPSQLSNEKKKENVKKQKSESSKRERRKQLIMMGI